MNNERKGARLGVVGLRLGFLLVDERKKMMHNALWESLGIFGDF